MTDIERITLADFVKENSTLFSTFSVFIGASAATIALVPGILGIILSGLLTILAAVFLFEICNLMFDTRFRNRSDILVAIALSGIFSLLIVHIGLYLKNQSNGLFYIIVWMAFFTMFFNIFWFAFRFRNVRFVVRWVIFSFIFILSLFFTLGTYSAYDDAINAYRETNYLKK